jgi:hypothetical protein
MYYLIPFLIDVPTNKSRLILVEIAVWNVIYSETEVVVY